MTSGPFKRVALVEAEQAGKGELLLFRRPPLSERIRLILAGDHGASGEGYPDLELSDYKEIGRKMRRKCKLPSCVDFRWYCIELGVRFVSEPDVRGCGGEIYLPPPQDLIMFRASIDPRAEGFSLGHGIAHHITEVDFGGLPHADTWRLHCELSAPAEELLDLGPAAFAAKQRHAPEWLIHAYHKALVDGTVR